MSTDTGSPSVRRRDFLKVLGAAGAATATVGCSTGDVEKLIPYVNHPDNTVPGVSTYYATTCRECSAGCGVIGETREGRVFKLEGNVQHPVNRGALCSRGQAALQGQFNPDRYRQPMMRKTAGGKLEPVTWDEAMQRFSQILGEVRSRGTAGNAAFVNRSESGSFPAFLDQWLAGFGMPAHYAYDVEAPDAVIAANRQAYGAAWPALDFKAARLVVSFGADFLDNWGPTVPMQLDWADARAQLENAPRMVYVGPRRTLTGLNADQWIACRPGTELAILRALSGGDAAAAAQAAGVTEKEIVDLRTELQSARPSMVLAGGWQANGTELALAAAQLNQTLGNVGTTIRPQAGFTAYDRTDSFAVFRDLVERMNAGGVPLLLLRNADLAHDLPQSLGVAAAIAKVQHKVAFSSYPDQTTELCDLVLPDHHPLESWGDAEPVRGTLSLQQPTMDPIFQTRQTADVLIQAAAGDPASAARYATVKTYRDYIIGRFPGGAEGLTRALPTGLAAGSAQATTAPARTVATKRAAPAAGSGDMFLVVQPSPVLGFGAGANKPWLQELPDPVNKIAWQTVAELHPSTAKRLGVDNGDLVEITTSAGKLTLPVWIYLGVRPDVVAVYAGRGHTGDGREYYDSRKLHLTGYGRYADGVGENAMVLVPVGEDAQSGGMALQTMKASVRAAGDKVRLVTTEGSARQHGRGIGQAVTVQELAALVQRPGTSADQYIPQADAGEPSPSDGGEPGTGGGQLIGPRKGNPHAPGGALHGGTTEAHGVIVPAQETPAQSPTATTPAGGALKGGEQHGNQDASAGGEHHFIGDASHDFLPGLRSPVANDAQGDLGDPTSKDKGMYDVNHWSGMARRRWAMTIDLARCTGCSACVTACYSENNLPTVGHKDQGPVFLPDRVGFGANITRSREMSWLRLERYFEGAEHAEEQFDPNFDTRFVPMGCQHCGNAPCEPVCPVYATYHAPDGLNVQVYNRCVGTRYCSNNCPYKVRYFNWFGYGEPDRAQYAWPEPMHMLLNPDVTVRGKGVMEKCTFCVQRIRESENRAKLEGRPVQPDEFTTACAQACPSRAIVFGDAADAGWTVSQLAIDRRAYHVFAELNTYTAVVYLKKVNHPGAGQPAIGAQGAPAAAAGAEHGGTH